MASNVIIEDSSSQITAKVSTRGQLITGPLDFSTPISFNLGNANTAFNFATPVTKKIFIITDIIVSSGSGASQVIEIFEADSEISTTVDKQIFELDLSPRTVVNLTGLNWVLGEGMWLNAKSSGTSAMVTIAGYFAINGGL